MKYRLKDRALQEKLDAMTKGGFSKVLEKGIDPTFFCEEFLFLGVGVIRVRIYESALEEVPEYDPHKWNEWPGVEPPGVLPPPPPPLPPFPEDAGGWYSLMPPK